MQDARREEVAMRLHSAAIHLLRRLRQDDQASMGLTAARASLLSVLVFGGPRTIGQLAAAEQVSFATISKLVSGLEAEGLVERKSDLRDGRITTVVASARARQILKRGRARRITSLLELLESLPAESWSHLEESVTLLEKALLTAQSRKIRS